MCNIMIVSRHGTFYGFRYEQYNGRVMLFSLETNGFFDSVRLHPFEASEIIEIVRLGDVFID